MKAYTWSEQYHTIVESRVCLTNASIFLNKNKETWNNNLYDVSNTMILKICYEFNAGKHSNIWRCLFLHPQRQHKLKVTKQLRIIIVFNIFR